MSNKPQCSDNQGTLPSCAPLAAGFVPYQQDNPTTYESCEGLTGGTLFPGLDLPLFNMPNKSNPYAGTPLGELMALDFAVKELNLYLDTHKDDKEAFEMFKNYLALAKKGRKEYVRRYGPVTLSDLENAECYTWIEGPWPWELRERGDER